MASQLRRARSSLDNNGLINLNGLYFHHQPVIARMGRSSHQISSRYWKTTHTKMSHMWLFIYGVDISTYFDAQLDQKFLIMHKYCVIISISHNIWLLLAERCRGFQHLLLLHITIAEFKIKMYNSGYSYSCTWHVSVWHSSKSLQGVKWA